LIHLESKQRLFSHNTCLEILTILCSLNYHRDINSELILMQHYIRLSHQLLLQTNYKIRYFIQVRVHSHYMNHWLHVVHNVFCQARLSWHALFMIICHLNISVKKHKTIYAIFVYWIRILVFQQIGLIFRNNHNTFLKILRLKL